MHLAMIFCVVMASAGAKELDPTVLKEFRSAFFRNMVRYVAAEYKLLLPVVADQSKNMTGCKTQIMELENDCKTCAKAECLSDMEPGTMDAPSENVERGGFLKHGNRLVRPMDKLDLDAFSEGLSSMFEMTDILAGLFGRRRRSVHIRAMEERRLEFLQKVLRPEVRLCVERCSECVPFLGDRETLLGDVCGQEFLDHQTALKEVLDKIRDLVHANGDAEKGKPQILSKVHLERNDIGHLLGDSGYGLKKYLLTPLLNPASESELAYNHAHSSGRMVVERAFGLLKSRFRCLHKTGGVLYKKPGKCCKIIVACARLHNLCMSRNIPMPDNDRVLMERQDDMLINANPDVNAVAYRQRFIDLFV